MSIWSTMTGSSMGSNQQAPLGGLLQSLVPPSPTSVLKTVGIIVGCVVGGVFVITIVYLCTRPGKGARNP